MTTFEAVYLMIAFATLVVYVIRKPGLRRAFSDSESRGCTYPLEGKAEITAPLPKVCGYF